jgi:hypothetical protein
MSAQTPTGSEPADQVPSLVTAGGRTSPPTDQAALFAEFRQTVGRFARSAGAQGDILAALAFPPKRNHWDQREVAAPAKP